VHEGSLTASCTLEFFVVSAFMSIAENIARVRERIDLACRRAGRNPNEIELMAVTKTVSPDRIREAHEAGIRLFGENRVQEFAGKRDHLRDLTGAQWHMIGHLQTNKAVSAAEIFDAIDSVDSIRLARKLNSVAAQVAKKVPILIEINIGGEAAKSGLPPDSAELDELLQLEPELASLELRGLMAVPPYTDDPEQSRPYFRRMKELLEKISSRQLPSTHMEILSIGMSHDFEVSIEEGSSCIRVGTAIFGERKLVRSKD
jgi:pyridoxal phosphate enzyme (YggS family)